MVSFSSTWAFSVIWRTVYGVLKRVVSFGDSILAVVSSAAWLRSFNWVVCVSRRGNSSLIWEVSFSHRLICGSAAYLNGQV